MLPAEARWLARVLTALPESAFPLLNVGSQTLRFRSVDQPYIDSMIFAPLRRLGRPVLHSDIRVGDGVDVVGDSVILSSSLASNMTSE